MFWVVDLDTEKRYRYKLGGWNRGVRDVEDNAYDKKYYRFTSLGRAYDFCKNFGYGVDVQYQNVRYHQPKSILENYKWKGPPKEEEKDD